jgi:hypothetical protein
LHLLGQQRRAGRVVGDDRQTVPIQGLDVGDHLVGAVLEEGRRARHDRVRTRRGSVTVRRSASAVPGAVTLTRIVPSGTRSRQRFTTPDVKSPDASVGDQRPFLIAPEQHQPAYTDRSHCREQLFRSLGGRHTGL